jgi:hypothetical protein
MGSSFWHCSGCGALIPFHWLFALVDKFDADLIVVASSYDLDRAIVYFL